MTIADRETPAVSFRNVVELHVLAALRRKHKIDMPVVPGDHLPVQAARHTAPLADQQMLTDGKDLFVEQLGKVVNISRDGQLEMRSLMEVYLLRIERDPAGLPVRLFPFTRLRIEDSPRLIVLNPHVQFGRPCIEGTGIPTSVIAERYRAGESFEALAEDYGQPSPSIQEAIRFEFITAAA